jgi:hypothetical protein
MLVRVRLPVLVFAALALPALAATEPPREQSITPVVPSAEQRVEPVTPPAEQHVESVAAAGEEQVQPTAPHGPVHEFADGVAKVTLVVVGTAIAIGSTIAALLFL